MKTKIIPFDLETAKKIQDGKIEGRIRTKVSDFNARIICFDKVKLVRGDGTTEKQIVSLTYNENAREDVLYVHNQKGETQTVFDWEHGYDLVLEVPEEAPEEQHPIEESELYQAGYKVGFEAGRCIAFDEKKGCAIKKEAPEHDDVEEVPTGDGSIVFLRHKKHVFKPFDKVLVRTGSNEIWRAAMYSHYEVVGEDGWHVTIDGCIRTVEEIIPYEGHENLLGTTNKPKEE